MTNNTDYRADDMTWLMRIDGIGRRRAYLICSMGFTRCHDLQTKAARDVLAERQRQITAEGMTTKGDDAYQTAELPRAAAAYILNGGNDEAPFIWPWAKTWWKPRDGRANYVRAAALLLAEIERIDRQQSGSPEGLNQPQQGGA